MIAVGWLVLALLFVDEVLAMVAAYVGGAHAAGWWLGVVATLVAVGAWALFASPKARLSGPVARPVVKVLVFGLASLGLWSAGHHTVALLFLAFSVAVNAAAQVPLVRDLQRQSANRS